MLRPYRLAFIACTCALILLSACGFSTAGAATPTPVVLQVIYPTPTPGANQLYETAEAYFMQGQYELAANLYTIALAQDPYLVRAYTRLGQTYANLGDINSAIASYSLAIQVAPYIPINYFHRGHAYQLIGASEQAIADFERFLEIETDEVLSAQVEILLEQLRQNQP